MKSSLVRALMLGLCMAAGAVAQAQTALPPSRGQLLYSTHCGACHSVQMHWRTLNLARDWDSLKAQVRRWQNAAALAWSDDDITEVARYLNDSIYRFPRPAARLELKPLTVAPMADANGSLRRSLRPRT